VKLPDSIETEQARYIHRTVPTAALGSMVVVGLVWIVFHNVVSRYALNAWVGALVALPCG
jgi:amino acid transporter